jgi:hypothetical protein
LQYSNDSIQPFRDLRFGSFSSMDVAVETGTAMESAFLHFRDSGPNLLLSFMRPEIFWPVAGSDDLDAARPGVGRERDS